jgi:hypothetical protein
MSKAFDKIYEGLTEALAVAKGEAEPYRVHYPSSGGLDVGTSGRASTRSRKPTVGTRPEINASDARTPSASGGPSAPRGDNISPSPLGAADNDDFATIPHEGIVR